MDRATAIRLLTMQFETGQRLLRSRPLSEDGYARWELNTKTHLEKTFGRGSPNIWVVIDAGGRTVLPIGADKKWWEAHRAERLSNQLRELGSVLRLLGANAKATDAGPQNQAMVPTTKPRVSAPKPQKQPETRPAEPVAAAPAPTKGPETRPPEPVVPAMSPSAAEARSSEPAIAAPPQEHGIETGSTEPVVAAEEPVGEQPEPESPPPPACSAAPASSYFTGIACLNGHIITGAAEAFPDRAAPRCKECGASALRVCRDCGAGLRGADSSARVGDGVEPPWAMPNYCHSCGTSFPWTTLRREAIEATIAELQELEMIEREGLVALVQDTILETPKTAVAVMRWQRALSKLTAPTRSLVTDVLKQAAVPLVMQHLGLKP